MDTEKREEEVMEDFVFGRLEADETTLNVERSRWSGIRHQLDIDPLDPEPGQAVAIRVSVGRDVLVNRVSAYFTTDGSDPMGSRGRATNGYAIELERRQTIWQPLYWDYCESWMGEIPGQTKGTYVRYRIEGWHDQVRELSIWSREMNIDGTLENPAVYGYSVDCHQTPSWAHEAVVYQIFVDRFAPMESRWLEPDEMVEFAGGTLQGIKGKLDYIAGLGVTVIWLTPIFSTTSYHGYDTVDYYEIDARFGDKEDLHALVDAAHRQGIRIILDFVANHNSHQSSSFQEALADTHSPYREWYSFDAAYLHGYRTFFTSQKMPQLNLDNPGARQYLIDAAKYWFHEFGIDGYRLDYAAGPSHDFWSAFGAACKDAKPDCWIFGEVTLGSDWLRTYTGRLDGCLDFSFTRAVRQLCNPRTAQHAISQFAATIERATRYFPSQFTRPTFIDNHDMNRLLWIVGGEKQRLRLALGLLFAFGGTPIIYYGTEVGLGQPRAKGPYREEARHPMLWGDAQDSDLLAYFRQLVHVRRSHPALTYGEIRTHIIEDQHGVWLAERTHEQDRVFCAVNASAAAATVQLPDGDFRDLVGQYVSGSTTLPALSLTFLVADA